MNKFWSKYSPISVLFLGFWLFAWMQVWRLPYSLWTTFAMIIFTLVYVFLNPESKGKFYFRPAAFGFIALFLLRVLGSFHTHNQADAWQLVGRDLPFLIFPILFSFVSIAKDRFDAFLRILVWSMGAVLVIAAVWLIILFLTKNVSLGTYLSQTKRYWGGEMPPPFFWQPSYVLLSLSPALPACIYLRHQSKLAFPLAPIIVIYISFLIVALLSGSRVNILIPFCFMTLTALLFIKTHWLYKVATVFALTITFAMTYQHSALLQRKLNDVPRSQLWPVAVESIQESPYFGKGTGASSEVIHYSPKLSNYAHGLHHFHNQYLEELVQFGWVGALVCLSFLLLFIIQVFDNKDFLLGGMVLILLLFMVIEAPFNSIKGIYFMVFWLNVPLLISKE
jgi:O-antigen ligase